jgi:Raf kinase inhibitor-like YbhB/YbcL family protein
MAFRLASAGFPDGQGIPKRYTCEGEDLSPPLAWSGAPPVTRSYLLVCDDPDAPAGTWHHWAVFDVPATATALTEGVPRDAQVDAMRQAINDFGETGYRGPCPPRGHGTHHYHFRLMALDVDRLSVKDRAKCKEVAAAARSHVIASAELVGTYSR